MRTAIVLWILLLAAPGLAQPVVYGVGQGSVNLSSTAMRGVSGLTSLGGGAYQCIDDIDSSAGTVRMHALTIPVNPANGQITGPSVGASTAIVLGSQFESIEYDPGTGLFFLCSEKDHTVRIVDASGAQTALVPVPTIYSQAQGNRSLESLAFHEPTGVLWTANEEPLVPDLGSGWVRLQRFVGNTAVDQFAYPLETPRDGVSGFNGLADLVALPDGRLIALERDYDGGFSIVVRLFLIDRTGASDVTALASLTGSGATPVAKQALLDPAEFPAGWLAGIANYESVALGPVLDDGSQSLLLGPADDNDNGFLIPETLQALRLAGAVTAAPRLTPTPVLVAAPNPFRGSVAISGWSDTARVLSVFDASGRRLRAWRTSTTPGSVVWDGRDGEGRPAPSGVYFIRVSPEAPGETTRIVRLP